MDILYYGACWYTNIGNAFIDYGSIYTIKSAVPNAKVHFASELPRWFYYANKESMNNSIDLAKLMKIDFVVVSGMNLCDSFIEIEGPILRSLSARGVKIIFNGCGGDTYEKSEIENFRRFLDEIKVSGFISRDKISFKNYKNCFPKSYDGIDCAFFLSDAYKPAKLIIEDYVVYNFDRIPEPTIKHNQKKVIRTHHSNIDCFQNIKTKGKITLCIETQKPFIRIIKNIPKSSYLKSENTLISDIPEDYLNIYANTFATYSDRVHACIATLSFNKFARLFVKSSRSGIFDRVGASAITNQLVNIEQDKMIKEKRDQISFLKEIFSGE